jgi:hypothetical protein
LEMHRWCCQVEGVHFSISGHITKVPVEKAEAMLKQVLLWAYASSLLAQQLPSLYSAFGGVWGFLSRSVHVSGMCVCGDPQQLVHADPTESLAAGDRLARWLAAGVLHQQTVLVSVTAWLKLRDLMQYETGPTEKYACSLGADRLDRRRD